MDPRSFLLLASPDPVVFEGADIAWVLVATALVLLMTPGLAFFYGGLVRAKNALNTMMMSFGALAAAGLAWAALGYSLAFDGEGALTGGLRSRPARGRRSRGARRAAASPLLRFPGDLRRHHRGARLRRPRRAPPLRSLARLLGALDPGGLRAGLPLGLGRRLARRARCPRLRRRHRGPRQRRRSGAGRGARARSAPRLGAAGVAAAQRAARPARHRAALVRLVRLQRRQRARRQHRRRARLRQHAAGAARDARRLDGARRQAHRPRDRRRRRHGDRRRPRRRHSSGRLRLAARCARDRRASRATELLRPAAPGAHAARRLARRRRRARPRWPHRRAADRRLRERGLGRHRRPARGQSGPRPAPGRGRPRHAGLVGRRHLPRAQGRSRPSRRSSLAERDQGRGLDVELHGEEAYGSGEGAILVLAGERARRAASALAPRPAGAAA